MAPTRPVSRTAQSESARGGVRSFPSYRHSQLAEGRPYLKEPIRVEDYFEDGRYVIRADLAGIDPEKGGILTITFGLGQEKKEPAKKIQVTT